MTVLLFYYQKATWSTAAATLTVTSVTSGILVVGQSISGVGIALGVFFSYVILYVNNIKMIKIMRFSYVNSLQALRSLHLAPEQGVLAHTRCPKHKLRLEQASLSLLI